MRRFAEPASLLLVLNGRLLPKNMRKEFITEEELWIQLRKHGVQRLTEVKAVYLEPDGNFSVILRDGSTAASTAI